MGDVFGKRFPAGGKKGSAGEEDGAWGREDMGWASGEGMALGVMGGRAVRGMGWVMSVMTVAVAVAVADEHGAGRGMRPVGQ